MVEFDDVGMGELLQVHNLPVCSLAVRHIPEGFEYPFQSARLFTFFIHALPHLPVGSLPHFLNDLVVFYYFYVHVVVHPPNPPLPRPLLL